MNKFGSVRTKQKNNSILAKKIHEENFIIEFPNLFSDRLFSGNFIRVE